MDYYNVGIQTVVALAATPSTTLRLLLLLHANRVEHLPQVLGRKWRWSPIEPFTRKIFKKGQIVFARILRQATFKGLTVFNGI